MKSKTPQIKKMSKKQKTRLLMTGAAYFVGFGKSAFYAMSRGTTFYADGKVVVFDQLSESKDRVALSYRDKNGRAVENYYDIADINIKNERIYLGARSADIIGRGVEQRLQEAGI